MKKKIVSFAAVLMAMAMSTSVFAVTPRESGDVDNSSKLTANDAIQILNSAIQNTEIANGDFNGAWKTVNNKVTSADADRVMDYVLQPENKFDEVVGLRFYSVAGYGEGKVANPLKNISLASEKNYDNTYADTSKEIAADSNDTLLQVADKMVGLVTDKQVPTIAKNINKVYFSSDARGDIYLTSKEGWAKLAYALKAINPVSPEDCALIGKAEDPNYATMDAATKARVDAFKAIGDVITKDGAGSLTLTLADVNAMYENAKIAFPGDGSITEAQYAQAADDTYAIYSGKYGITMTCDKLGTDVAVGQSADASFAPLVDLLRNYNTKTIQDVRNTLGDKISATSGANTVVAELFASAVTK